MCLLGANLTSAYFTFCFAKSWYNSYTALVICSLVCNIFTGKSNFSRYWFKSLHPFSTINIFFTSSSFTVFPSKSWDHSCTVSGLKEPSKCKCNITFGISWILFSITSIPFFIFFLIILSFLHNVSQSFVDSLIIILKKYCKMWKTIVKYLYWRSEE